MGKPFDATLNELIDSTAADWAAFLAALVNVPPGPLADYDPVRDGNVSTTAYADKVFRVNGPKPAYLHLELQSWSELGVPERMQLYNTVLRRRHGLPVYSVLLLLRKSAVASDQTGVLRDLGVNDELHTEFRYTVLPAWEQPADRWLTAGVGLSPMALLTDEASRDLPAVAERFHDRLRAAPVSDTMKKNVLGSAFVLGGLRYDKTFLVEVFTTMSMTLEDSTTYQWILSKGIAKGIAKGEANGEARTILRLGTRKFGPPDSAVAQRLAAMTDLDQLDRLADRIFDVVSWDDLLATP